MLDEAAYTTFATLHGLRREFGTIVGAPAELQGAVKELLGQETSLLQTISELRTDLRQIGVSFQGIPHPELSDAITWLKANERSAFPRLLDKLPEGDLYKVLLSALNADLSQAAAVDLIEGVEADLRVGQPPDVDTLIADMEAPLRRLAGRAEQLDVTLFSGVSSRGAMHATVSNQLEDLGLRIVDWSRLDDLYTLKEKFDGIFGRTRPGRLGTVAPWFVAILNLGGRTIAVAELPRTVAIKGPKNEINPKVQAATYILDERFADGTWQEVLTQPTREEARIFGAIRLVHPPHERDRPGQQLLRIINKLQDLTTVPAK